MTSYVRVNDTLTVKIVGELNRENGRKIMNELEINLHDISRIILDMQEVSFIDEYGIGLLVYLKRKADNIELVNCSKNIALAIKLSGLNIL